MDCAESSCIRPESVASSIAQFQNEDRIKISSETVQSSVTCRKTKASEAVLHRITPESSGIEHRAATGRKRTMSYSAMVTALVSR